MKKLAAALCASMIFAAPGAFAGQVSSEHPDGILCPLPATQQRPAGISVFYISAVLEDGQVLYQTLGNQVLSLTFDASGSLLAEFGRFCEGMSLSELEAAGKTFDF